MIKEMRDHVTKAAGHINKAKGMLDKLGKAEEKRDVKQAQGNTKKLASTKKA